MRTWILIALLVTSLFLAPTSIAGESPTPTSMVASAWEWVTTALGLDSETDPPTDRDADRLQQFEDDEPPEDEAGPLIIPTG